MRWYPATRMRGCQGSTPAVKKKRWAAIHIASGGTTALKSRRSSGQRGVRSLQTIRDGQAIDRNRHRSSRGSEHDGARQREHVGDREVHRRRGNLQHCRSAQQRQAKEEPPVRSGRVSQELAHRVDQHDRAKRDHPVDIEARRRPGRHRRRRPRVRRGHRVSNWSCDFPAPCLHFRPPSRGVFHSGAAMLFFVSTT